MATQSLPGCPLLCSCQPRTYLLYCLSLYSGLLYCSLLYSSVNRYSPIAAPKARNAVLGFCVPVRGHRRPCCQCILFGEHTHAQHVVERMLPTAKSCGNRPRCRYASNHQGEPHGWKPTSNNHVWLYPADSGVTPLHINPLHTNPKYTIHHGVARTLTPVKALEFDSPSPYASP